jgi:hypothetical protein
MTRIADMDAVISEVAMEQDLLLQPAVICVVVIACA